MCGEYLKWYCCPSKEGIGTIAETWIDRGDLLSSHYSLNCALELLLNAIFALNEEFLPPPKWRIFYLYKLKWLPENYKELLKEALRVSNLSQKDFTRRLAAIGKLWYEILPRIGEKTGLTPEKISKYYVEKILRQTWRGPNSKESE